MPDANGNLTVEDVDFTADVFVIPVGDFTGQTLLFNDPLLRLSSFITGFDINFNGFVLTPTLHINILPVWDEYSGAGVSIRTVESLDDTHADLNSNAVNGEAAPIDHGTAVASIVVGEANNGFGSAGVAYGARFFHTLDSDYETYDVVQSSRGGPTPPLVDLSNGFFGETNSTAALGRGGLGTIWVNSAGNGGHSDTSSEMSPLISRFEIISVAQGDAVNNTTAGSTFGSGIHVTGLTGNALSQENIIAADLPGDPGAVSTNAPDAAVTTTQNTADIAFELVIERGLDLSFFGLDTGDYQLFGGTSAAAPVVSGAVALVLEASGNNVFGVELGWRDVQELLAVSARHIGSDLAPGGDNPFVPFDGMSQLEHHPWFTNGASTINGGGFHVSSDYGFGYVDVHGAVRLAETWALTRHSHNLITQTETVVNSNAGLSFSFGNVLTFEITAPDDALDLDVLELVPVFSHEAYREVQITVTSPSGTQSILFDTPGLSNSEEDIARWIMERGEEAFGGTFEGRTILSRQFWGEETEGVWTITIEDMVDNGNEGTLFGLDLVLKGDLATEDDTYYFTDDWALQNDANGVVPIINDDTGVNSLNLAAVSHDISLSLRSGSNNTIGGNTAFRLGDNTSIALAITGDGNDVLAGTAGNETLIGMHGNDVLRGGDGDDLLSGGRGDDTVWAGAGDTGDDTVIGGTGDDILAGGAGHDFIVGGDANAGGLTAMDLGENAGADTIYGGAGNDTLVAGGADEGQALTTGNTSNTLYAGTGDDVVIGDNGADILGGGTGSDSIAGNAGNDTLYGGADSGADTLLGGSGDDDIFAGGGADSIDGGAGNDLIFNGSGNDMVSGGAGNDTLWGSGGDDMLTGGAGADTFAFAANNGEDTVSDFDTSEDILDLSEFNIASFAALQASISQDGTNSIITLSGTTIILVGIDAEALSASDVLI